MVKLRNSPITNNGLNKIKVVAIVIPIIIDKSKIKIMICESLIFLICNYSKNNFIKQLNSLRN